MPRLLAVAVMLWVTTNASGNVLVVSARPLETSFRSTLTTEPADIWGVYVGINNYDDPIFSMDLSIPGNFVQLAGSPAARPGSGVVGVAGVLPAADTYFSVPEDIDPGNIAIAPGTAIDNESLLAAAYTVTGDTPIVAPREIDVIIATLAVPAGQPLSLPVRLGTAAVRTSDGPIAVPVWRVPEPASAVLVWFAFAAVARYRR